MIKIKIMSIGKTKDEWLETAISEFEKRLKGSIEFKYQWLKNNDQLIAEVKKESQVICLDPKGHLLGSREFARFFEKEVEEGGARLSFVIGGAEGLSSVLREKYPLVSLSKLTFTHQLTRLVLVEQIYRAYTIIKGLPYHK